jgi:hypothetical protein
VYLAPFEAAVKTAGLQSMMNGYNELDGIPCAASEWLLDKVLHQEWGFDGVVVSDYFAVDQLQNAHMVTDNKMDSAVRALTAGIDIELPNTDCYGAPLKEAVACGLIDEAVIDSPPSPSSAPPSASSSHGPRDQSSPRSRAASYAQIFLWTRSLPLRVWLRRGRLRPHDP